MLAFTVTFKDDLYSAFQTNFLFHSLLHHGNYCALHKMVRNLVLSLRSFLYLLVHLCFRVFRFSHCSTKFFPYIISDISLCSGSYNPKRSSDCCCADKCFCCFGVCCGRSTDPESYVEEGWGCFYWKQYKVLSKSQHKYSSLFLKNLLVAESLIRCLVLVNCFCFHRSELIFELSS